MLSIGARRPGRSGNGTMASIRKRAGPERIRKLCAQERGRYTLSGPDDRGTFWARDESRSGFGYDTQEQLAKQLEIRVAFAVLERHLRIEDAHDYDWHLYCNNGAEHMVETIVHKDFERRVALAEMDPFYRMLDAIVARSRRPLAEAA